ncbi:hypothetical protein MAPG_11844 [Magnaporthiopsis poae ATCC 64411]|uniref:Uncharacterized protein n=1 Tax=Magnaporthiopsis poae (strain ATCC 64411 / 73-15) TaxID=644358 RepID=A0A0C4EGB3_MAGP6|nr:hypothetical protein MAPG_11844 [Magnaporthiopsis poae ATCC 64411]
MNAGPEAGQLVRAFIAPDDSERGRTKIEPAVPKITDDFKFLPDVGWHGSAYKLGSVAPLPLTGKIYSFSSLKWSFLGFFTRFEVWCVLYSAVASSTWSSPDVAGIANGPIAIISASVPLERRPPLIDMTMAIVQLDQIVGPSVSDTFFLSSTSRPSSRSAPCSLGITARKRKLK